MKDGLMFSRRRLLTGSGALCIAFLAGGRLDISRGAAQAQDSVDVDFGPWVRIAADGRITIRCAATEMGQGISTALPMILAEEMDADWQTVETEQVSGGAPDVYGNPKIGGILYTAGSTSIEGYFDTMRRAGATVRQVLIHMAAAQLEVSPDSLDTRAGQVLHHASGRMMPYGEVAQLPLPERALPEVNEDDYKSPASWRIIGQNVPRLDISAKSRGETRYSLDVRVPGMAYAVQILAPVEGETPQVIDDAVARSLPGVVDIVALENRVNVLAESLEAALAARDLVRVEWTNVSPFRSADSETMLDALITSAGDEALPAVTWHKRGDLDATIPQSIKTFTATYATEPVYHAQMEPLCALANVDEDGKGAEVWLGTQSQSVTIMVAAGVLKTTPDRIRFHSMQMGGGFGRRTVFAREQLRDALLLSAGLRRAVKLIWTREDDVKNGWFRPAGAHHFSGLLNDAGDLIGMRHRIASPSIVEFAQPAMWESGDKRDLLVMEGSESTDYDIPNLVAEHVIVPRQIRVAAWRGIGAGQVCFARECFIDEIANSVGSDPVNYRRRLLAKSPRGLAVLEEVLRLSDYGNAPEGRAHGLAFAGYKESRGAGVAEVSVDEDTGQIRVHKFWAVADVGLVIHPENLRAQIEGGVIFGLSGLLRERITVKGGMVEQSNFYDYDVLRMTDMPIITVGVVTSKAAPTGAGEIGVPMTGGAVANAVFGLTGKRIRQMPFVRDGQT
ncbi:molybdopterin cofactor-binding domain-containing protein [Brucella sp. BE17]|uniref:xanthine dehydrogenase family protein molybdopterin-binding subunit n=1 Tax=Brucella sp. BE17 TaxID=3142977 RepID=UPI0031BB0E2C